MNMAQAALLSKFETSSSSTNVSAFLLDIAHTTQMGLNATNSTSLPGVTFQKRYTLYEQVIYGTWLSIAMILAIFGNLMVIAVVWRHRGMRTRTNMFLVSLAIADFLVGLLLCPMSLSVVILQDWIWGPAMCVVNSFLNALCLITSIQNLMFISIHKYLSITKPLTRITKGKILIMIIAAWSWGFICALLTTVIFSHAEFKDRTMQCGPAYPGLDAQSLTFHFIIQFSNLFLPLAVMLYAYFRMFKEIRSHMQRLDENTAMDRDTICNQQRRVTITLFIVLACFILCWLPYCVYSNYATFKKIKKFPAYYNALAYLFGYMNSACNPLIYAWRSPSFREGYKEILCQEPSYVVSDDTVVESSPNPLRRFSTFISSVRGPRHISRSGSEESTVISSSGVKGQQIRPVSDAASYKLLNKLTGRTKSGNSIIRRDGSVILVKNGKVISMKLDTSIKRQDSQDDVFLQSPVSPSTKTSSPSHLPSLPEDADDVFLPLMSTKNGNSLESCPGESAEGKPARKLKKVTISSEASDLEAKGERSDVVRTKPSCDACGSSAQDSSHVMSDVSKLPNSVDIASSDQISDVASLTGRPYSTQVINGKNHDLIMQDLNRNESTIHNIFSTIPHSKSSDMISHNHSDSYVEPEIHRCNSLTLSLNSRKTKSNPAWKVSTEKLNTKL